MTPYRDVIVLLWLVNTSTKPRLLLVPRGSAFLSLPPPPHAKDPPTSTLTRLTIITTTTTHQNAPFWGYVFSVHQRRPSRGVPAGAGRRSEVGGRSAGPRRKGRKQDGGHNLAALLIQDIKVGQSVPWTVANSTFWGAIHWKYIYTHALAYIERLRKSSRQRGERMWTKCVRNVVCFVSYKPSDRWSL